MAIHKRRGRFVRDLQAVYNQLVRDLHTRQVMHEEVWWCDDEAMLTWEMDLARTRARGDLGAACDIADWN